MIQSWLTSHNYTGASIPVGVGHAVSEINGNSPSTVKERRTQDYIRGFEENVMLFKCIVVVVVNKLSKSNKIYPILQNTLQICEM